MSVLEIAQSINDSALGTALQESLYAFPVVEGIHLLGLAVSFGLLLFIDLRLIGWVLRDVPVSQVVNQLHAWVFGGFAVTFISGALLFVSEASTMVVNTSFWVKTVLMVIAVANALVFEYKWGRRGAAWVDQPVVPASARFAGWASLSLWTLVTISGRLIPYYPG